MQMRPLWKLISTALSVIGVAYVGYHAVTNDIVFRIVVISYVGGRFCWFLWDGGVHESHTFTFLEQVAENVVLLKKHLIDYPQWEKDRLEKHKSL